MRFAMAIGHFGRDRSVWYPAVDESQWSVSQGLRHAPLADMGAPLSYILGPAWEGLRSKISLLRGLDDTSSNSDHNTLLPTTGSAAQPHISIDCVLARSSFYDSTPVVDVLRTNPETNDAAGRWGDESTYSWAPTQGGILQMVRPEWDVRKVYERYFDVEALRAASERDAKILSVSNAVFEHFRSTMAGPRIGAHDRRVLDGYMALIADLDADMMLPAPSCDVVAPEAPAASSAELHAAMSRLEVAALACGTTRVVMHTIGNPELPEGTANASGFHSAAHDPKAIVSLANPGLSAAAEFNRFFLDRVANLLGQLDQVQEFDGSTLLDNTFFIYANDDGDGAHEHLDLPVIVAGGQGTLRLGQYIDYRPRPHVLSSRGTPIGRPYNQLLVTALEALGVAPEEYRTGDTPGFGHYTGSRYVEHYRDFLGEEAARPLPFVSTSRS